MGGLSQVLFADMKPSPLPLSPNTGRMEIRTRFEWSIQEGEMVYKALSSVDRVLNVKEADEMSNANTFEFSTKDRSPFLLQPSGASIVSPSA